MVSSFSNDISVRLQGVFVVTVFTPALALKKRVLSFSHTETNILGSFIGTLMQRVQVCVEARLNIPLVAGASPQNNFPKQKDKPDPQMWRCLFDRTPLAIHASPPTF